MTVRVAYLVTRFPTVTETFILREMRELERQGTSVELYVPLPQRGPVVHPEAEDLARRMHTCGPVTGLLAWTRWWLRRPASCARLVAETFWHLRRSPPMLLRALLLLPSAAWFAWDIRQRGLSHVHAHYATHGAYQAWVVRRLAGVGYSFTAHAHDIYVRRDMLSVKVAEARFVVTISEHNRELIRQHCAGAGNPPVHVVRCGVPLSDRSAVAVASSGVSKGGDGFRVLTVAALRDYKGIRYLVQACDRLREVLPGLQWELIGGGPDRAEVDRLVLQRGLGDVLQVRGPRSVGEVAACLEWADAFALSSVVMPDGRREGVPVALMEAMAAGVPVVATDISGIPELVVDGETGWLVPERDADALAKRLAEVAKDPDEARRRADAGRRLVAREYDLTVNVARLGGLFLEVGT